MIPNQTDSLQKEKPNLRHGLILAILSLGMASLLLDPFTWNLTGKAVAGILAMGGVSVTYVDSAVNPLIALRLVDQTIVVFYVLIECSGLITVAAYTFLSSATMGLLQASLRLKLSYLFLGIGIGLTWNVLRIAAEIATAYSLGMWAFTLSHYLIGPVVDILWVVMVWSLGMAAITKRREIA